MLYSPLTDCVHMTGGTATHDAIVWGSDPEEAARRRAAGDPLLKVCVLRWCVGGAGPRERGLRAWGWGARRCAHLSTSIQPMHLFSPPP